MYIVLETHGGPDYVNICVDEDGNNLVFNDLEAADQYAQEECQDGMSVRIS